jgi:DNA-binding MarR family transcriptional regulator
MDIASLLSLVTKIRGVSSEMPAQTLHTFLLVAQSPGISMQDLNAKLELSSSATSRNVSSLSFQKQYEVVGLGLVEALEDPKDRRIKRVWLTPKGQAFAKSLLE